MKVDGTQTNLVHEVAVNPLIEAPLTPALGATRSSTDVLLVAQTAPEDPTNGGHMRWWNLLEGRADVLCLAREPPSTDGGTLPGSLPWRNIIVLGRPDSPCQLGRWGNDPIAFAHAHHDIAHRLSAAIAEYRSRHKDFRLIITDHALALLAIPLLDMPFIFHGVDSNTLYFWRRGVSMAMQAPLKALNSFAWSRIYRAVEENIARHAALYIVPGDADRRCILSACPQARVLSIPNGTEWIDRPPLKPAAASSPPLIAFHGVMTWDPNLSSAAYLIKKVFPLVRRSLPQARIGIAGGPIPPALAALARQPGVEVLGFVADLRAWLSECHVYAMPMIQGSGVKNKLIEAMAAGLPVVTNSLGAEGLPKRCRKAIVIADGPRALAQAIIDLINDPTRSAILRSEARLAAEREFDWQSLVTRYLEAIESVSQCPSGKSLSHWNRL